MKILMIIKKGVKQEKPKLIKTINKRFGYFIIGKHQIYI